MLHLLTPLSPPHLGGHGDASPGCLNLPPTLLGGTLKGKSACALLGPHTLNFQFKYPEHDYNLAMR